MYPLPGGLCASHFFGGLPEAFLATRSQLQDSVDDRADHRTGVPDPPQAGGRRAADEIALMPLEERPTAVFCANDQMALGLLRSFANQGRRVPEQVGVVGFDDVPDAANYQPPLTTIRQDFTALAHRAVQALVADIEGTSTTWSTTVIPTTLIDRDSTR